MLSGCREASGRRTDAAELNSLRPGLSKLCRFTRRAALLNNHARKIASCTAASLVALVALTCFAQVQAQSTQEALNLNLPSAAASPVPAVDPPGTYYGDVGDGKSADTDVQVSGAVSTTIGYARGFGTGVATSAELNVIKQTEDGKTYGVHIRVTDGDALHYRGRYDRRGW